MTAPSVLYIASASIRDPLIVSQVIRYLEHMQASLTSCHLITFERESSPDHSRISDELQAAGIRWSPIKAWKKLRTAGFWYDRHRALTRARRIVAEESIDIVHCRSFLAGTLGRKLKSDRVRFLYDMRGLWSLEKRDKGTIRNPHAFKVAQHLEHQLFRDADRIVSLTHQGRRYLERTGVTTPIDVIPTCVDLERFQPQRQTSDGQRLDSQKLSVVSAGTLGSGYLASEMFRFCRLLQHHWPEAAFQILTGSQHEAVVSSAAAAGLSTSELQVSKVAPEAMPRELARADVGLCFVKPTEAKIASCPTKLGEYLACGIPVVATDGIGDVTEILEACSVGVIIRPDEETSWPAAIRKLATLLNDPRTASRCRRAAEERFDLKDGVRQYLRIYDQLPGTDAEVQREAA